MRSESAFRRNLIIVACLHVGALLVFIVYGALTSRPADSGVTWLDGGGIAAATAETNPETEEREPLGAPEEKKAKPEPSAPPQNETKIPTAPSELVLPTATPTPTPTPEPTPKPTPIPTPTPEPKPTATPTPTPRRTPKPTPPSTPKPKSTPQKTPAKPKSPSRKTGTPKPGAKSTATPSKTAKSRESGEGGTKSAGALESGGTAPGTGGGNRGGAGKAGGGNVATDFGWYHAMIHDRFYSQWQQPTSVVSSDQKFVTTVAIRIQKDGSISTVSLANSSGNVIMDESVMAAAQRVTQIDPLPAGLGGDYYDVKINFELEQH